MESEDNIEALGDIGEIEEQEEQEEIVQLEKVKKPRSDKQIEAFKKALEVRDKKRNEKKEVNNTIKIEKRKEIDDKIVQKALIIKKKQIRDDLLKKLEEKNSTDIENEIKTLKMKLEKSKIKDIEVIKPAIKYR